MIPITLTDAERTMLIDLLPANRRPRSPWAFSPA